VDRNRSMELVFGRVYGMSRTMSFLPELKAFLKENGLIYTVRKYRMVDAHVEVEGVGQCHRVPIKEISSKEDLLLDVKFSGFPTVEDWWKKIREFIPRVGDPKYLYRVSVNIIQEEEVVDETISV
jgi:hypothetical protein